jgi:hypothetical protein
MSTITAKIQLRRDTSANWTSNNPILLAGEMALSTDVLYSGTDQPRYKIGNGIDTWLNLDYVPEGGGGSSYPENLFLTVVNKTGDNLLASGYKVLKVQTAQGQRLAVDYALADSDANSADTIGVVYENINNNQTGKILVIGELTGLNTTGSLQGETWNDGDLLFLSPFVDGGITNIRPTAPNHGVIIGYVVYSHVNQGKIYIKIDNGYEIGELHNCYLPTPTHNDGIFWSSGTTRYENKSIATALGYTPANQTDLNNKGYNITLSSTTNAFSPADSTTYYFGSARTPSVTSKDNAIIITKTGTIKQIGIVTVINTTLSTTENSTLSVRVRSGGINGSITDTVITNTLKFNATYISTLITGLNISVTEGDAIEMVWLTPAWVTNPVNIFINTNLFIS